MDHSWSLVHKYSLLVEMCALWICASVCCVCVLRPAPYCINMFLYNLHCWGLLVRWSCDACCPQASTSTHGARGVCRHKHNNWMTAATWTVSHKVSPTPWNIRVWLVTFTPRLHCTGQLDQQHVMPLCSRPQDGHTSVWRWCQWWEEGNIRWKMCSVYFSINGCTYQWNASESCELYHQVTMLWIIQDVCCTLYRGKLWWVHTLAN